MKKILTSLFYSCSLLIYYREPSGRGFDWSGSGSEFDGLGILITIIIIVLFYGVGGIIALIYDFFQNIKLKRKREEERQKLLQQNKEEEKKREIALLQQKEEEKEKEKISRYIVGRIFSLEAFLNSGKNIEKSIYSLNDNNVEISSINELFRYVNIKGSSRIRGLYYAKHMDPYIDYLFNENIRKLKVVRLISGAYLIFLNENLL